MPARIMDEVLNEQSAQEESLLQQQNAQNGSESNFCSYNVSVDVVISGISGRLPESDNIEEFRQHLMLGEDMVTEDNRRWEPG